MKRNLIYVIALAAGLALVFAAVALGNLGQRKEECAGVLCVGDNGGISPSRLPRHGKAPITARIIGEIGTRDGSHPPALQTLSAEISKTIAVDTVGLPTCSFGQLTATSTAAAKRACGDAIVGSGSAEVEVAFPEQKPFSSTGPLVLFNGGTHGRTTRFLLHAYVDVPAPTAVVVKATVTRIHDGPFGLRLQAQVPKIAGGYGSATKFDLKMGRRFTYKGRKKSFLVAGCPAGRWGTKGRLRFADATVLNFSHTFPCTPTG
ncbi:MAG: hypothetical protein ACTHLH_08780 [Solirubrobacterales bacterium]